MQACLGLALTLSVFSIRDRIECEDSEDEGSGECYGMEPGDFVSVTIYILQVRRTQGGRGGPARRRAK
jgi:hypothetical protein